MANQTLPENIFGVEVKNYELIDLAYKSYLAGGRNNPAKVLKRGEVSGGGKKPWRQKGTGRARIGSIRAPHWRGGGVVFGPNGNENYKLNLSKKMRRGAIRQALSLANKSGQVQLAELSLKDIKTKDAVSALEKLKATGRILIVVPEYNEVVSKSVSNIPGVRVSSATHINVFDIMNADSIIIDPKALSLISEWLGA
jgi:large subunit ribosomal protein L4